MSIVNAYAQHTDENGYDETKYYYGDKKTEESKLSKLKFGAFIAPNVSWMKPTSTKSDDGNYFVQSNESVVGFTWGLMADYFFTENYGISTGFQLNSTGGNIVTNRRNAIPDSTVSFVQHADFTYRAQYLEIPFNLKLRSDEINAQGIKVFGQVGLSLGINIGKKANYSVNYWDADASKMTTVSGDNEKLYGSFTVAPIMLQMNVGGGFERKIAEKTSFYLGLFFNNGFLPDATKPDELNLEYKGKFTDGAVRLNNMSLKLGLIF